jgi:hypothetical protein
MIIRTFLWSEIKAVSYVRIIFQKAVLYVRIIFQKAVLYIGIISQKDILYVKSILIFQKHCIVCQDHFSEECIVCQDYFPENCFERHLIAVSLGFKASLTLKPGAVLTILKPGPGVKVCSTSNSRIETTLIYLKLIK